jgi:hypothetical protein
MHCEDEISLKSLVVEGDWLAVAAGVREAGEGKSRGRAARVGMPRHFEQGYDG